MIKKNAICLLLCTVYLLCFLAPAHADQITSEQSVNPEQRAEKLYLDRFKQKIAALGKSLDLHRTGPVISCLLHADGTVTNAHLEQKSGDLVVDAKCLNELRAISFERFPDSLSKNSAGVLYVRANIDSGECAYHYGEYQHGISPAIPLEWLVKSPIKHQWSSKL